WGGWGGRGGFGCLAEVGWGSEAGSDDAGIEQLFAEYTFSSRHDVRATAGWIRLPFGRWDAFTMSRPLVKDRQFYGDEASAFQLRRTSPGIGLHASSGPFEVDLAYVDREPTTDFSMPDSPDRDAVGRIGFRRAGFSAGLSYLHGYGTAPILSSGRPIDLANVTSYGMDLEMSRGPVTLGGEVVTIDIDGRGIDGYYVQGA